MSQTAVLDQSDDVIRSELGRLESERKKITASLDQRISQLRSILGLRDTLPLFDNSGQGTSSPATRVPPGTSANGAKPRGKIKARIYAYIQSHPTSSYQDLVRGVYGEFTKSKYNSARSMIMALRRDGWLSGEKGNWIVGQGDE